MKNPLWGNEGKFVEEYDYVAYQRHVKTGNHVITVGDLYLCKTKNEALKKCVLGALRCSKEDIQKLNWVLKGLK